jgi:hypothetical protein
MIIDKYGNYVRKCMWQLCHINECYYQLKLMYLFLRNVVYPEFLESHK